MPGFIYVDNGTQIKALQYATFSVRDLEAQVQDSLGIKIILRDVVLREGLGYYKRDHGETRSSNLSSHDVHAVGCSVL